MKTKMPGVKSMPKATVKGSSRMYTPSENKPRSPANKSPKMMGDTKTFKRPGISSGGATISASPGLKPTFDQGTSSYMVNEAATPSGSRPGKSRFPLSSSAPANPHMIRPAPSPLK